MTALLEKLGASAIKEVRHGNLLKPVPTKEELRPMFSESRDGGSSSR
jgi:hypothetical protein